MFSFFKWPFFPYYLSRTESKTGRAKSLKKSKKYIYPFWGTPCNVTKQIYFRRDIVLPGDLFPGTVDWEDREDRWDDEVTQEEDVEDTEPGVMLRWWLDIENGGDKNFDFCLFVPSGEQPKMFVDRLLS